MINSQRRTSALNRPTRSPLGGHAHTSHVTRRTIRAHGRGPRGSRSIDRLPISRRPLGHLRRRRRRKLQHPPPGKPRSATFSASLASSVLVCVNSRPPSTPPERGADTRHSLESGGLEVLDAPRHDLYIAEKSENRPDHPRVTEVVFS